MSELKWLYVQGMETHQELVEFNRQLEKLHVLVHDSVTGNEAYQEVLGTLVNGMGSLGTGVLTTVGWVGGKTVTAFAKVLGGAGNLLSKAFADNDVLIRKILQQFSRADEHKISFSKEKVKMLTSDGEAKELSKDMDTLIQTLELIDKYGKDLLTFLDARMGVLRDLRNVKTTEDIYKVIDKHDALKYPVLEFHKHDGGIYRSEHLPGGMVFEYEVDKHKYLMSGDGPEGSAEVVDMSKSEVSALLVKLDKVNNMHKRFKTTFDNYLTFIKEWGDMVKAVESNLSRLEKVSKSAQNDAEKLLGGEPAALAFYSGFTPRVISYTDRYIHGVLGVFV